MLQTAALRPSGIKTVPCIRNTMSELRLVAKLMAFACPFALFKPRRDQTFKSTIKKVPVPGP